MRTDNFKKKQKQKLFYINYKGMTMTGIFQIQEIFNTPILIMVNIN
jgi:hypothetical protein